MWRCQFSRCGLHVSHLLTAEFIGGDAGAVKTHGRYAEAEPPYTCALAIRKKALGPEHPYVAADLNNLANARARAAQLGTGRGLAAARHGGHRAPRRARSRRL